MQIYSIIGTISTVVSFLLFLGIVRWAYSKRRQAAFADAANAPFALPDESDGDIRVGAASERRS